MEIRSEDLREYNSTKKEIIIRANDSVNFIDYQIKNDTLVLIIFNPFINDQFEYKIQFKDQSSAKKAAENIMRYYPICKKITLDKYGNFKSGVSKHSIYTKYIKPLPK